MQIAGIGFCAIRGCDDRAAEIVADIALCQGHIETLTRELKTPLNPFREVVYYVGWRNSEHVKIGTSARLRTRLHGLSAGVKGRAHLLAVEPGSYSVERKRHREFRVSRIHGTELFRLTPQISGHIESVRGRWPQWLELSGVGPEWLP